MDIAKSQQIATNTGGVFFGLGLGLFAIFGSARPQPFFTSLWLPWLGVGLFTSLITMGFAIELLRCLSVPSENTKLSTTPFGGIQLLVLIRKLDQSLTHLVSGLLFMLAGAFFSLMALFDGNLSPGHQALATAVGWIGTLLLWPFLKNRFGAIRSNKGVRDYTPSRFKGSFIFSRDDQGIRFTSPPDGVTGESFTLTIEYREMKIFSIMKTKEESQLIHTRKIAGNLELMGKAMVARAAFLADPTSRPNYWIDRDFWNPGDVYVLIEGDELFYFVAVQSQYIFELNQVRSTG